MTTTPADGDGHRRAALRWLRLRWDRAAEATLLSMAAVVLVLTYRSVSRTPFVADQLAYLASGGVAGLFLLAVGLRLRITGDLRDEWHKLDRIEAALHEAARSGAHEPVLILSEDDDPSAEAGAATTAPASNGHRRQPGSGHRAGSQRGAVAVSATVAVSLALVTFGWWRAAHADTVSSAFAWCALAAAAGVLLTAGVCAPTAALRRRLGRRKAHLFAPFLAEAAPAGAPTAAAASAQPVVVGPGLTRFHRDGCPATAGLAVEHTDRGRAAATLEPCEICAAG